MFVGLVYFTISPTFTLVPGKIGFVLVILIALLSRSSTIVTILAIPTLNLVVWTTSAEKVFADPTVPYTDLMSEIPYEVTFLQILH